MRHKPSFLERLTGSVAAEENFDDLEEENAQDVERDSDEVSEKASDEEGELALDVYQTPTEIVVKTLVAGVKPEDLDISITREMVTIRGKREGERSISGDDFFHQELYWGSFSRSILLPTEVDVEEAEAVEKHGLLIIRLPKINKDRQTKLRVKSNT